MTESAHLRVVDAPSGGTVAKPFSQEDEAALRESLRRCSEATVEAALAFRKTGAVEHLPVIIIGVVERFVEPELRPRLAENNDDLRMIDDLGIDSLTMMEIVMLVEETVGMSISNDELRNLRTLGDIKVFIDCKARGVPPPAPAEHFGIESIVQRMPIQPPFLFLNEADVSATAATGKYKITGEEFFLKGHFKDNPVMPASIMLEALGQLGVFYLLSGLPAPEGQRVGEGTIFFTSSDGVRCHRKCVPGDVLTLSMKPKRVKMPLAVFEGSIRVGSEKAVIAEEITLTFGFVAVEAVTEPEPAAAPSPESVESTGT